MTEQPMQLKMSGNIDYNLYGEDRERTGVIKVVLQPVGDSFAVAVGEEVVYRVIAVHRETVET